MSKKTPVKKSKRRLKRSVRRSLAAAMMITAIAVAAIPVPENYAEDGDENNNTTTTESSAAAYRYPTADMYHLTATGQNDAKYLQDFGINLKAPTVQKTEIVKNADGTETEIKVTEKVTITEADGTTEVIEVPVMIPDPDKVFTTHYIASTTPNDENGGVSFRMEWQYQYFLRTINGLEKGIICGYNDSYNVNTLVVSTDPIHDYVVIPAGNSKTKGTFEYFKEQHKNDSFTVNPKPSESDENDQKFKRYFPQAYEAQVQRYKEYEDAVAAYPAALDAYQKKVDDAIKEHGTGISDELLEQLVGKEPVEPKQSDYWKTTDLTRAASQFSTENDEYSWRLYYCDIVKNTDIPDNIPDNEVSKYTSLQGYILVRVADSESMTSDGVTVHAYVPRRIDLSTIDKAVDDELGFRIQNWTSFLGIGDEAFKNVANVANIELPEALKYIGDSAFEGSFITSIKMMNLENIGNYAFKNCPRLSNIEMVQGVKKIGTEAFYGLTLIRDVLFPGEIEYIGPGAFANCALLNKVDLSSATLEVVIDDYAFYNDGALNEINFTVKGTENPEHPELETTVYVTTIGKAAFAVWDGVSGNLANFAFPSRISEKRKDGAFGYESKGLGDYILAGRTNLKDVTMPAAYGMAAEIALPGHIFQNCIALERVNFPDTGSSCGFVKFDPDLFASVSNPKFYVQGPPYTEPSNRDPAMPRRSTWMAYTAAAAIRNGERMANVPYVYYLNGKRYTEVCDREFCDPDTCNRPGEHPHIIHSYLMCIDENGVLISCSLLPDTKASEGSIDLIIPAEVAGTTVTGIASDCFANDANEPDNRKMSKAVRTLTIIDDSKLETINNNVFANWENLERVYFGNSVRNVGDNAFQNCVSLRDVYFNTPEEVAATSGAFKMGANAFQTNSSELTFHGPINTNYAPYDYAVMQDTKIDDTGRGKRICYKSLAPTYFTVMRDNRTTAGHTNGQPTLLDYPKYDQIAKILGETYAVRNGDYIDSSFDAEAYYNDYMESLYYSLYSSTQYDTARNNFKDAWVKASTQAEMDALYENFELYGPWVSPTWIKMTEFTASTGTTTSDAGSAIIDFFFEPIVAQAAPGNVKPVAYFDYKNEAKGLDYGYDVYDNIERIGETYGDYQRTTEEEGNLLYATQNITVPDGVTSIDVKGFLGVGNSAGTINPNSPNLSYLDKNRVGIKTHSMYNTHDVSAVDVDRVNDIYAGLFSGNYADYEKTDSNKNTRETLDKGNDRLKSIDLNQVESLPDYAFDSCENLERVTIGKACEDIKKLPFRGCTSLTTLNVAEDNPKYLADNRILYSRNDNASYTIEECLETRGRNNNNQLIAAASDTNISQVSKIAEAAFEECNFVSRINLESATALTEIPESTFRSCESLTQVDLPSSVNKIDKYAFYDDLIGRVVIPGREVFISTDAFKHEDNKNQPTYIRTYADSSARRYADTYGDKVRQYYLEWEDIGELWTVNFYDYDGTLVKSLSVEDGQSVKTKDIPEMSRDGYTFAGWVGTNNVDVKDDEITQNTDFIAKYTSNSQMVDGKWAVNFYDGLTGESFWPTQLVEDGDAAEEPPYTPYHEGYKFLKYSADCSNVTSNMSIIALYEVDGAGGNAPGTTSGSSTDNGGNGNNGTTSNRSSSSTNTSGSSTSTTSSTSAKPRHTVTVVNGYGSGSYAEGETVIIVANEPAAGQKFSQWRTSSEGVELVMILASATTFTMPANDVIVTAEFTAGTTPTASTTPAPASGVISTNPGGSSTTPSNNNGNTRVDITKPGISNRNLATANVNGSTDNFIVKISETPEATQAVVNALTNKYGNLDNILYYAMDISLYDSTGTTKITDTTGLSVDITIPLPDALVTYGGNNMMGAVVNSDQLEDMSERFTTIGGVPCISFTATHFSPYTIYVNTQNLSEGLLDVTPKTGDPIHPKWFLSIGLASLSIILFMKKDKKTTVKTA